jgi:hypothetical protein
MTIFCQVDTTCRLRPSGYGERIAAFIAFARTTGQQRKPWHPCFVQAKDQDMRDFRDAKAMAGTLRAALAAKRLKITVSESLELIAKAFGVADWNTLSAAVRARAPAPRNEFPPSPPPAAERILGTGPHFSREL